MEQIPNIEFKQKMYLLLDMGFSDFSKNYAALMKYNGDLTNSATELLSWCNSRFTSTFYTLLDILLSDYVRIKFFEKIW